MGRKMSTLFFLLICTYTFSQTIISGTLKDAKNNLIIGNVILKEVVNWWKGNRYWRMDALRYRLDLPDPAFLGELQLSQDGDNFVAFISQVTSSAQALPRKFKLPGLNRESLYEIKLWTPLSFLDLLGYHLRKKQGQH